MDTTFSATLPPSADLDMMSQPLQCLPVPVPNLTALKASCAGCGMHRLCLPMGLDELSIGQLDRIIGRRRRIERDERLYRMEDTFSNLYAIRFGHFKTYQVNPGGEQQIT